MADPDLTGRVALVTGASRGIGAAVAVRLAKSGAHVVAMARTVGGLSELDDAIRAAGGSATLVPQDIGKLDELDAVGPALHQRFGRLDVFVANAGILGDLGPVAATTPGMWEDVFRINVLANQRLIRSLDPLLRGSDAGRAVFVTSGVAQRVLPYWGAYAASKAALDLMVKLYAAEVAMTPLKVNLLSPGAVRTRMRAQAFPGEDPMTLRTPEEIAEAFMPLVDPACTRSGEIVNAQPPRS